MILKATKVDGIYDSDPMLNPNAIRYDQLSYDECMLKKLRVMDQTAISLCSENQMPIVVFDLNTPGNIVRAVLDQSVGTRIC